MIRTAALAIFIPLVACGDDRPPAPTAEQSHQLNEAEELLDREAANEEGPEDRSPGPSQ